MIDLPESPKFTKFDATEANEWLGGAATVTSPKTLAELFELLGEVKRIGGVEADSRRIGFGA